MGEKIKDAGTLKIGHADFLIELNEAYFKGKSRAIHIQNEYFRFSIDEPDFLKMAGHMIRAESELEYLKGKLTNGKG